MTEGLLTIQCKNQDDLLAFEEHCSVARTRESASINGDAVVPKGGDKRDELIVGLVYESTMVLILHGNFFEEIWKAINDENGRGSLRRNSSNFPDKVESFSIQSQDTG